MTAKVSKELGISRAQQDLAARAKSGRIPEHIGFIMDGNGRWAEKRGLTRLNGHRAGVEAIRRCLPALLDLSVKYCTLYTFSLENWKRPAEEIRYLMDLVVEYASSDKSGFVDKGIRVIPIGRWQELPAPVVRSLSGIAKDTKEGTNLTVLLAINYGGRQEIIDAFRKIVSRVRNGEIKTKDINEKLVSSFLQTAGIPDPDLIVRTSGEKRLSNFLVWQAAYTELVFTDVLWPDFAPEDIYKAVIEYSGRKRRFGGVSEMKG